MNSFFLNPNDACAFLIVRFLYLESREAGEIVEDQFIPDGYMAFVFNFKGRVLVSDRFGTHHTPPCFMVVPRMESLVVKTNPPMDTMVVVCRSTVLTRLLQIDLSKNRSSLYIDSVNCLPKKFFAELKHAQSREKRKELFEAFVLSRLQQDVYQSDAIDNIYQRIMASKGENRVNELLCLLDQNPRSFRRRFIARAGVSAKVLSRIVRINFLWDCYLKGNKADFSSMVYDGNYYDQAHLIHDFKAVIGEAPFHFFKKEQDKVVFLSGKILE
jgi:hypothetical protein